MVVGKRLQLGFWAARGLWGVGERERERTIFQGFCFWEAPMSSSSSSVQALTYASSNSFLEHKSSSSSSTATWRRRVGSTKRRSLLLHIYVHPQLHFTHQRLLQYSTAILLPRAQHRIETQAAFRDHGNCKFSCVLPLSPCLSTTAFFSWVLFAEKFWPDIFWMKPKGLTHSMEDASTSSWFLCDQTTWF